jgi:hypothetical protein
VQYELTPPPSVRQITAYDVWLFIRKNSFVPGMPPFYNPGWLTNYGTALSCCYRAQLY